MDYKNILLINYGGIGDEILFLPTIASIKKQYVNAKITLALEPRSKSIKDLTNYIDDLILVDIKCSLFKKYFNILKLIVICWFKRFDCVISSGKSPLIAIILFLTFIKERVGYCSKTDFLLTKKVKLNENQYAANMYHDLAKAISEDNFKNPQISLADDYKLETNLKKREYICIHPGVSKMSVSKGIYKCPNYTFWLNLISGLLNKNKQVVLLGTKDDKELIDKIVSDSDIVDNPNFFNYFGKTKNIMEMAYIMKYSSSVICVDSAPLHVAVCVKAKIYALFGPTNENKLVPNMENIMIIQNNISCRPCLWNKRKNNCENSQCLNLDYNLILDKIN